MIEWFHGFDAPTSAAPSNGFTFDIEYDSGSQWTPAAAGRFGGSCAGGGGGNILYLKKSLQPLPARYFGKAILFNGYFNHTTLFQWMDFTTLTPTVQAYVGCTTNGELQIGSGASILGTTPPFIFRLGAWYFLEGFVNVGVGSAGAYELRLNGQVLFSGSGTTQASPNAFSDGFIIGPNNHIFVFDNDFIVDDLYVLNALGPKNNSFIGEQKVITSDVNSDFSIQFARNSGTSNFGQLTSFDGDSTFTDDDTIGHEDLFGITPLEPTPNNYNEFYFGNDITATKMTVIARKTDVGYRNIGLVIKSGSTTEVFPFSVTNAGYYLGYVFPLLSTYESSFQFFENDPNTGTSWTQAGVNATKIGYSLIG